MCCTKVVAGGLGCVYGTCILPAAHCHATSVSFPDTKKSKVVDAGGYELSAKCIIFNTIFEY